MKTAIYARVSTSDQNCEVQLRELREYVARRGWTLPDEYVDTGFSGAKASRPALDRLMADAAKRKFDCVVVWKVDRFGRSVLHLNQQLAALTAHGVRFNRRHSEHRHRLFQSDQSLADADSCRRRRIRTGNDS